MTVELSTRCKTLSNNALALKLNRGSQMEGVNYHACFIGHKHCTKIGSKFQFAGNSFAHNLSI